jgi:glucosyl-dolichyl phosphate glucuronosyltransferase
MSEGTKPVGVGDGARRSDSECVDSLRVSVVIPAYTMARWTLMCGAIDALEAQSRPPDEVLLCIDHNRDLYQRCLEHWPDQGSSRSRIRVLLDDSGRDEQAEDFYHQIYGTRRRFGAGSARNVGAWASTGDVLVFQDDDAIADETCVERILEAFESDAHVVAVGGAPLPSYETSRPRWFPFEFDWVFGCAYRGMPTVRAPYRHLIGAILAVRRTAFDKVEGFHSVDFDDLDLCQRVAAAFGPNALVYEPGAIVRHYVPAERVSWRYFWRRPLAVNRAKVIAFDEMGDAANLTAELEFVSRSLTAGLLKEGRALLHGDGFAAVRMVNILLGVTMAGTGHLLGLADKRLSRRRGVASRG